jgi:hypothetical protein
MTRLPDRFIEDRALRDAARTVFMADLAHARTGLSPKGVATRVGGRIGEGAKDVLEVARVQAEDNRGVIAILIGALVLWFARQPLFELLGIGQPAEKDAQSGLYPDAPEAAPDDEFQSSEQSAHPSIPAGDDDE